MHTYLTNETVRVLHLSMNTHGSRLPLFKSFVFKLIFKQQFTKIKTTISFNLPL